MPRRLLFTLTWLLATAAATMVAWAGVQIVAGRVVEPLAPLPPALASAPSVAATSPTLGPTDPVAPTGSPPATATASPEPAATGVAGSDVTRSYELVGGTVTLRFSPQRVDVVTASPRDGFALRPMDRDGPTEVRVEFRRADDTWRSRLRASWEGAPDVRIEERDRT